MIGGIIATHGSLGESLIDAAAKIMGESGLLISISNDGLSPDRLDIALQKTIKQLQECSDIIIFIGLMGGSVWSSAVRLTRDMSNLYVISGINLPMLISFLTKRESHSIEDLLDIIKQDAIRGIQSY